MHLYYLFIIVITIATIFSYLNYRFIKWPAPIAVMAFSLVLSVILMLLRSFYPHLTSIVSNAIGSINFYDLLMRVFLGFILFAGAYKIPVTQLRKVWKPVTALALLATFIAAFMAGALLFLLLYALGIDIPLLHCLLFGALIAPTDPVAVLGIIRKMGIPASIEMKIAGESIFNDAIAIVLFTLLYKVAAGNETANLANGVLEFFKETGGGILWGVVLAGIGFFSLQSIDNYKVEILITLVIVMGGYAVAHYLQISGPIAMVIAGLITGSHSRKHGLSQGSEKYVSLFWGLVEDFLNLILFLLIGFEILVIPFNGIIYLIALAAILPVLVARLVAVFLTVTIFKKWFERHSALLLTWCALRGGISIALALSLHPGMHRYYFVIITYVVAVFSIIVQGLTVKKLIRRLEQV